MCLCDLEWYLQHTLWKENNKQTVTVNPKVNTFVHSTILIVGSYQRAVAYLGLTTILPPTKYLCAVANLHPTSLIGTSVLWHMVHLGLISNLSPC